MKLNSNIYTTRLAVRPDDIDMFQHVHSSRYVDYVLAARFDQMKRCYNCGMDEFLEHGLGWVLVATHMEFKRPLKLGDMFDVNTHLVEFEKNLAHVAFDIKNASNGKTSCIGWAKYTLVHVVSGKSALIPEWALQRYSLP